MNTAEVLSSEKQQDFRIFTLSVSTIVDCVKDRQCKYSVTCNKIMNFMAYSTANGDSTDVTDNDMIQFALIGRVKEDFQPEKFIKNFVKRKYY
jgi:hypothetical protein